MLAYIYTTIISIDQELCVTSHPLPRHSETPPSAASPNLDHILDASSDPRHGIAVIASGLCLHMLCYR